MSENNIEADADTALIKLLIEELNKNYKNNDSTSAYSNPLNLILIILFGLIFMQKVFKYGHRAYKHYSAVTTRRHSPISSSDSDSEGLHTHHKAV